MSFLMDVFSREIRSWVLSRDMGGEHTRKAIRSALLKIRGPVCGVIVHSDQGVQYGTKRVRSDLKFFGVKQSMSRRGNCYDNAFVESFFHTLKNEGNFNKGMSFEDVEKEVKEFIFWYNERRIHSSLDYVCPKEFRKTKGVLKKRNKYIVLEGNRRLAALKCLTHPLNTFKKYE